MSGSGDVSNVRVEPLSVTWGGDDLGLTEGDIVPALEEQLVDINAHQEGTNLLDHIKTGSSVELPLTLKETSIAQLERVLLAGDTKVSATAEVTDLTVLEAGDGSNIDGSYFILPDANGTVAFWIDVDDSGTSEPSHGADRSVEITTIVSTPTADTPAEVATKIATAVQADSAFVTASATDTVVTTTDAATGGRVPNASVSSTDVFTAEVTTEGASAVAGWGSAKDFTNVSTYTKKLKLHPVSLASSDTTRDLTFWKAYPLLSTLTYSGENPLMAEVTFRIIPDCDRNDKYRLFAYGDVSSENDES